MAKRIRMTKAQVNELEERALAHVHSVPYSVSLRWVFYRLLQDGIYSRKGDYNRWCSQASKFRHNGKWPPDLLEDTTREPIIRGLTKPWSEADIIESFLDLQQLKIYFTDSHFTRQASYVEIWFEARAMTGQFERYTKDITLRPFGGMASIPLKYQAAQKLIECAERFGKPGKVLYFGDCDKAGRTIYTSSTSGGKGFLKWCNGTDIETVWCGLTPEQADRYDVPENPDKPGQYQWEALTDSAAREIISHAVQEHIDTDLIGTMEREARQKAEAFAERLSEALSDL